MMTSWHRTVRHLHCYIALTIIVSNLFLYRVGCAAGRRKSLPPYLNEPRQPPADLYSLEQLESPQNRNYDSRADQEARRFFSFKQATNWTLNGNRFGQMTAVDINSKGQIVIFHRGDHVWNSGAFNEATNVYERQDEGPIQAPTIIVIDPNTEKIIDKWGGNIFYLPHGLSYDRKGFLWVTDVALHQVFKFGTSRTNPLLTIGKRFEPGNTNYQFCKPTSVAVDSATLDFYVTDGYCSSRIMRFNAKGKFISSFGWDLPSNVVPQGLAIPHKIVLIEKRKEACIADRENGRILCYTYPDGRFTRNIQLEQVGTRLFSLSYSPCVGEGMFFAVNGPALTSWDKTKVKAFIINASTGSLITSFAPSNKKSQFSQPHDIAVSIDCRSSYVVEIGPNNLYKFTNDNFNLIRLASPIVEQAHITEDPVMEQHLVQNQASSQNEAQFSINSTSRIPVPMLVSSNLVTMGLLIIPLICVFIYSVYACYCRTDGRVNYFSTSNFGLFRNSKRNEHFDLGRLLSDPEKSGFNRVAMEESDIDLDLQSDSEVEEFNVHEFNAKSARKV